tara:strand:+ start:2850 stop:3428 length:579 start_codon:yes stop_codon:yes gene_type:complete
MQPLQWHDASPSPHLILDDFAPSPMIRAAAKTWPDRQWSWWHKYDDETALKLATMGRAPFPPASQLLLDRMAMLDVSELCHNPFPDLSFHAGGMHTLPPGGFLGLHKDAEIHPLTGWTRMLNAILFIEGDGDLYLGRDGRYRVDPVPGRLVLFSTRQAWHGVHEGRRTRKSLALYWWGDRPEAKGSERAVFE